jgi:histidinol-phosphate aminotransferase
VLFRPRTADGDDVWQQLVDRSVLVRNCSSWPRLDGCLRVTIGTTDEDDRFLDALREILT